MRVLYIYSAVVETLVNIMLIKWVYLTMKSVIIRLIDWWWVYTCILFGMCVCVRWLHLTHWPGCLFGSRYSTYCFYWVFGAFNRYNLHFPCRSIHRITQGTARVLCLLRITLVKHCYELSLVYTLNKVS